MVSFYADFDYFSCNPIKLSLYTQWWFSYIIANHEVLTCLNVHPSPDCFIMQQAMLKKRSRIRASFLLIQLWRASVCKASERFSLQQWTSWMILNQAFFFFFLCAALQNSRTMGKLSSETNSHTQNTNSLSSDITSRGKKNQKNICLLTTGLIIRDVIVSSFWGQNRRD